jgi:hypothetical protein
MQKMEDLLVVMSLEEVDSKDHSTSFHTVLFNLTFIDQSLIISK